ncbi:lipocalin family protein [Vibrio algarum]|uniref:Outer membrane lipoprotein Blc n=1 Tax=Vibrio algarum TaxID=3020714 RepID=A0ABT4YUG7_9VIBR|nr:lipocalin family protein [Vibrio sp. KJ40-1]MDB1125178.1 lipocalin family protein [Vibrio sp. KJ40-1]
MKKSLLLLFSIILTGCLGMPENVQPVENFDVQQYMGKWYEVARLDHSFERGLSEVTAEYSIQNNGKVTVINRGYSASESEWKQAEGKAYFVNTSDQGYLKVSFFGPFYGSYVVFELGENYQYAFVSGPDNDYLWLLSRTPEIDEGIKEKFTSMSNARGFDTKNLIWVSHNQ